jgi:hypothetical protein
MNYSRVEVYEGCSLSVSRMFRDRVEAEEYRESVIAPEIRIIDVDENGTAIAGRAA